MMGKNPGLHGATLKPVQWVNVFLFFFFNTLSTLLFQREGGRDTFESSNARKFIFVLFSIKKKIIYIFFHSKHHQCVVIFWRAVWTGRVCFCQLSTPSPSQQQQSCGKQVRSCQSNGRLQQEETGRNRCEQLPTAALLSLRIHCATSAAGATTASLPCLLPAHTHIYTLPQLSHWICFNKRARNEDVVDIGNAARVCKRLSSAFNTFFAAVCWTSLPSWQPASHTPTRNYERCCRRTKSSEKTPKCRPVCG